MSGKLPSLWDEAWTTVGMTTGRTSSSKPNLSTAPRIGFFEGVKRFEDLDLCSMLTRVGFTRERRDDILRWCSTDERIHAVRAVILSIEHVEYGEAGSRVAFDAREAVSALVGSERLR